MESMTNGPDVLVRPYNTALLPPRAADQQLLGKLPLVTLDVPEAGHANGFDNRQAPHRGMYGHGVYFTAAACKGRLLRRNAGLQVHDRAARHLLRPYPPPRAAETAERSSGAIQHGGPGAPGIPGLHLRLPKGIT